MSDSMKEKVVERGRGAASAVASTPGWVWIVIGGVVLLVVGIVAATAVRSHQGSGE